MLYELSIQHFALLEQVHLRLSPGFTVLTGETGAGKSILVDAIAMLLGGRASAEDVRHGADQARIEGVFVLPGEGAGRRLQTVLEAQGLWTGEPLLVLAREIRRDGRSLARVNGRAVPVGTLAEIGRWLVDLHSQHEHLSLLRPEQQRDLLDRFGGLVGQRERLAAEVRRLRQAEDALRALQQDERELARRADLLRYQINEIEAARLTPGEEEGLLQERMRLLNAERLAALAGTLYELCSGGQAEQRSALELLGLAARALDQVARIDPGVKEQAAALAQATALVEELGAFFRAYRDRIEYSPTRLAEVEERLEVLRGLKRKYGEHVAAVLAFAEQARQELAALEQREERAAALAAEVVARREAVGQLASDLTRARAAAAAHLAERVRSELADLNLQAGFAVALRQVPASDGVPWCGPLPAQVERPAGGPGAQQAAPARWGCDEAGLDEVEFRIAPNPGEPLRPAARIASGGELARLMLALESILAAVHQTPTLIFDEIEGGMGGRSGHVLGEKLYAIAARGGHQVLCVTHLPQIAAYADAHYFISKRVRADGRTVTEVEPLDLHGRGEELAQMLGGTGEAATALLAQARQRRQELVPARP